MGFQVVIRYRIVKEIRFFMRNSYHVQAFTAEGVRNFCERRLAAWTGNDPSRLASFYTDDPFYSDPSIRQGVSGTDWKKRLAASSAAR